MVTNKNNKGVWEDIFPYIFIVPSKTSIWFVILFIQILSGGNLALRRLKIYINIFIYSP